MLGRQTREHNDIDILLQNKDRDKILYLLEQDGFFEDTVEYSTENHLVWQDNNGRVIDLHFIDFNSSGDILFDGESYH